MKHFHWLVLTIWASACGNGEQSAERAQPPAIHIRFSEGAFAPQAATEAATPPVTLVFRFLGPDGAIEQRVSYETGRLALDDLRVGTWQVEAEGLDEQGLATWQATPVVFTVREDRTSKVDLVFSPL